MGSCVPAPAQASFGPSFDQKGSATALEYEKTDITISKRVDEVNLVFTVTDKHGNFIEHLTPEAMQVLDNHHPPRGVKYFHQQTNLPLRVALLIDLSDSVRGRFAFEKKAAAVFLKHILRPGIDQAMVVGFDQDVHVVHELSGDVPDLAKAVSGLKAGGNTAFHDAVTLACEKLRSASEPQLTRRAIILISDGVDTASQAKLAAAEDAALRAEVVMFALSTNSIHEPNAPGNLVMRELTGLTGGHILPAYESDDLKSAFRKIEKALRSQYAMGYQPEELKSDGSFRSIEVTPRRRGLRVQCRKGYFAPAAAKAP